MRKRPITKEAIFDYVYAVLHDPIYRKKYATDLSRNFPRVPFYSDFWWWSDAGRRLVDLHINYESVEPYPLVREDVADAEGTDGARPKCVLRADKSAGVIYVDGETTLRGLPSVVWEYRLGNRSALEWVLEQYKEKLSSDPTMRGGLSNYQFGDYKEFVIVLLSQIATLSVRTQEIVGSMLNAPR
jgi:predicted helicase